MQFLKEGLFDPTIKGRLLSSIEGAGPKEIWGPPESCSGLWQSVIETVYATSERVGNVNLARECRAWTNPPEARTSKRRLRILVVDDEDIMRRTVCRLLPKDWETTQASSASQAIMLINKLGTFDVVITDFEMPGMSGLGLLSEIEATYPDTRRVMMSGLQEDDEKLDEAMCSGLVQAFWHKLDDHVVLINAVNADSSVSEQCKEGASAPQGDSEPLEPDEASEDEPDESEEYIPASGLMATLEKPAPISRGRLTRAHVKDRMLQVVRVFADEYDWEADLGWFTGRVKGREPTEREREWLKSEIDGMIRAAAERKTPF